MTALTLTTTGRSLLSNRLRVFSTASEHLTILKTLESEGPLTLSDLQHRLVGTKTEDRTWTPTLVENVVKSLIKTDTVQYLVRR